MSDVSIPYTLFKTYKSLYQATYNREIKHPLEETILRPNQTIITDSSYLELIKKRSMYLETFSDFARCYPEDIDNQECCPSILPNIRLQTAKNGWTLIDYGKTNEKSLIYSDKKNRYVIFRNDNFKKTLITFPATKGLGQGINEMLKSELKYFPLKKFSKNIKLTKYFGQRAYDIIPYIFTEDNIKKMKIENGYQIIFTGHSLGAAMAAATCFFALDQDLISRNLNHPFIVTFGQPRTGNDEFVLTLMKESELIYRVTNDEDCILEVPLHLLGYRHTQGRFKLIPNKENYSIVSDKFVYDIENVNDEQELNAVKIIENFLHHFDKHTYYFGQYIGGKCPPKEDDDEEP